MRRFLNAACGCNFSVCPSVSLSLSLSRLVSVLSALSAGCPPSTIVFHSPSLSRPFSPSISLAGSFSNGGYRGQFNAASQSRVLVSERYFNLIGSSPGTCRYLATRTKWITPPTRGEFLVRWRFNRRNVGVSRMVSL